MLAKTWHFAMDVIGSPKRVLDLQIFVQEVGGATSACRGGRGIVCGSGWGSICGSGRGIVCGSGRGIVCGSGWGSTCLWIIVNL